MSMKGTPAAKSSGTESRVIDAWLATHSSPNTRSAYRIDLEIFGRWCAQNQAIPLLADSATVAAFYATLP